MFSLKKKTDGGIRGWGRRALELAMACMLLVCFYILSREAALTVGKAQDPPVILVDAGHGGADPGMVGVGGLEEKDLNLAIAQKLKADLENRGYRVVMTRETDAGLYEENAGNKKRQDMEKRIAVIEKEKPALTVSIHQNSYSEDVYKRQGGNSKDRGRKGRRKGSDRISGNGLDTANRSKFLLYERFGTHQSSGSGA